MLKNPRRVHALVALLLAALTTAGYAAVIGSPFFLGDDFPIINKIAFPEEVPYWGGAFSDFYGPVLGRHAMYRPLYTLSFEINYSLFEVWALGYQLTNLLLHVICSFFVYLVALELVRDERRQGVAILSGALFALHPIHPEAVSMINGRVDLVSATFFLPALFFFLRWLRTGLPLHVALSLAFFFLALMSKEMAVTLPGLLFLCAVFRTRSIRNAAMAALPFAIVLAIYLLLRTYFLSGVEGSRFLEVEAGTMFQSLHGFAYRTAHLFIPVNLDLLPDVPRTLLHLVFLFSAPVLLAAVYLLFRARDKLPLLLFTLYAVSVVPVFLALSPGQSVTTSRWFYIPSIFASILVAYLLWSVVRGRARYAASCAACAVFLVILIANNSVWVSTGEISEKLLQVGAEPKDYPATYKGAYMFADERYWQLANSSPFERLRNRSEPSVADVTVARAGPGMTRLILKPRLGGSVPFGYEAVPFDFDPEGLRVQLNGEEAEPEDIEPGHTGKVIYRVEQDTNVASEITLEPDGNRRERSAVKDSSPGLEANTIE